MSVSDSMQSHSDTDQQRGPRTTTQADPSAQTVGPTWSFQTIGQARCKMESPQGGQAECITHSDSSVSEHTFHQARSTEDAQNSWSRAAPPGRLLGEPDSCQGRQGQLGRRPGQAYTLPANSKDRCKVAVTCSGGGTDSTLRQMQMISISWLIYYNPSPGQKVTQFPLQFAHSTIIPHSLQEIFSI